MLCTFRLPTILCSFYGISDKSPDLLAGGHKLHKACEQKDQTLKKIRILYSSDSSSPLLAVVLPHRPFEIFGPCLSQFLSTFPSFSWTNCSVFAQLSQAYWQERSYNGTPLLSPLFPLLSPVFPQPFSPDSPPSFFPSIPPFSPSSLPSLSRSPLLPPPFSPARRKRKTQGDPPKEARKGGLRLAWILEAVPQDNEREIWRVAAMKCGKLTWQAIEVQEHDHRHCLPPNYYLLLLGPDPDMPKSQIGIATISNCSDLKLHSANEIATRIASRSVEKRVDFAAESQSFASLRFLIAGGLDLKSLAICSPCPPAEARRWVFFWFFGGKFCRKFFGNFSGPQNKGTKIGENFGALSWEISGPQNKGSKNRGIFRGFFVRDFVARQKIKGAQTMKCTLWTETLEFRRLKVPNSRFALHGKRPSLIHGLCAFFASNSRFMRPFSGRSWHPSWQPLLRHHLSSRFALHGLRAFDFQGYFSIYDRAHA